MKKFITFFNSKVHINALIFPPVDCDHHAMTALFEYRGSLAWKIIWENLYSVKCYDKSNMNVFALSLWENFRWGLIYLDQFISLVKISIIKANAQSHLCISIESTSIIKVHT